MPFFRPISQSGAQLPGKVIVQRSTVALDFFQRSTVALEMYQVEDFLSANYLSYRQRKKLYVVRPLVQVGEILLKMHS